MVDVGIDSEFPVSGLLPKKETGVTTFLNKYPEYDGRGVTIAVFDSGVDPGAPGLQKTSDGKTKVIERFDCSGCGDVCTSTITQATDGYLTGLTGRKLKVPDSWKNPSGNYRIGVKNAFELYPKRLKERIQEERKEKLWSDIHKINAAESARSLTKFETQLNGKTNLTPEEKLEKEDLEVKIEILNNLDKKHNDLGPIYDCILFHDGSKWVACVDTSENGELEKCPLLGEYSITHEFSPLTTADQLNYSINVHDEGNTLELVGLCSSHGTHVASIASAYFEDEPDKNGIAPGAQIVSLIVGDGRLGTMETGTALVRAIIKVMEMQKTNPIHVINMSYGEHAHWSNTGRIGELMSEVVNDYGIVWVVSGSNHGPALNTIGTPPDISQETLIGIGAYVSPDMMVAEYSMRQKLCGMAYTWSSRGPTIDGGFGISVCAPGGAITSVPNFTLRMSQLMNGTSMASPHAAGAVALLISGLLQRKLPYSPYNIKRALENCATFLDNVESFAQGHGLLQVDKTFEYLVNYHNVPERDVRFHITCGTNNTKGIYIRSKSERSKYEYSINIEPCFKEEEKVEAAIKINFNMKLAITCKASYLSHPSYLDMSNGMRSFSVKLDTSALPPGVHHTSVDAYDITCIAKGPVFRVPITIIRSTPLNSNYTLSYNNVLFQPNTIKRTFVVVPELATWAVLRMRCVNEEQTGRFVIHCLQLLPKQSCKYLEINKQLTVTSNMETAQSFQVQGGLVLEVVIAKYWANLGDTNLNYSIAFHGIKPSQQNLSIHASEGIPSVYIETLQGEEIAPIITFKYAIQILRPMETKVSPLTARDVIPKGRQIYELVLTYNFHLSKPTDVSPNYPVLSDLLYESEFESQLWLLFDCNKQYLGCGDSYPAKYSLKLEKGDYVVKLQIRHEKKDHLDKLNDTSLLLRQKLSTPITMDLCGNYVQAIIGEKKVVSGITFPSSILPLYVAMFPTEKLSSKLNNTAHYLAGTITYAKDELGKRVDTYPVKYFLNEASKKNSKSPEKEVKPKVEEYREALRDLKTFWLAKIDDHTVSEKMYEDLCKEFPDYLPIHGAYFQSLISPDGKRLLPIYNEKQLQAQKKSELEKIITVCNKVLSSINEDSLLIYFAIKNDQRPDAAKIKITMERQKSLLLDALCYKGITLCRLLQLPKNSGEQLDSAGLVNEITEIWKSVSKFVDLSDKSTSSTVLYFAMWHASILKQHGRMLKFLLRLQEEKASKEVEEKFIEVCEILGWDYVANYLKSSLPIKFPHEYRQF